MTEHAGVTPTDDQGELLEREKRENVIRLAFGGRRDRFEEFCGLVRAAIPENTGVVLRGSAVTGKRWSDGAPFDSDGPGTSDLDLTLVGEKSLEFFTPTGFFVPGVHSRPLSEEDPDIAPALVPLREKLMAMAGRPVNIQATRDIVMYFRGELLGQPYVTARSSGQRPPRQPRTTTRCSPSYKISNTHSPVSNGRGEASRRTSSRCSPARPAWSARPPGCNARRPSRWPCARRPTCLTWWPSRRTPAT